MLMCFTISCTMYSSGTVASKDPCMGCFLCPDSGPTRLEGRLSGDVVLFRFCPGTNEARSAEILFGIPSSSNVTLCSIEEMT